jgi:hypothetical protein
MPKPFKRTLSVPLSVEDKAKKADEFASVQADIEKIEANKSAFASACKEKLDVLYAKHSEIGRQVRSGVEERRVDCEAVPHPSRPIVQIIRLDTGEVIDERPMTDEEKQAKLSDKWDALVSTAGKGDDEPAPESKPEKAAPKCPALLGADDEIWQVCGKPGKPRVGGYCDDHKDRKKQGDIRARDVAARQKREQQVADLAAEAAGTTTGEQAAAGPTEEQRATAGAIEKCLDCGEAACMCEERAGDAA